MHARNWHAFILHLLCVSLLGFIDFVRQYGYEDKKGRPDRLNFGGTHKFGQRHPSTGLTLELEGYDPSANKIIDANDGLRLIDGNGHEAMKWNYSGLIEHWTKKHALAVYIPSLTRTNPTRQYCYGNRVSMGEQPDFLKFLDAIAKGTIYYDPALKIENNTSNKPLTKRRSQFRITRGKLSVLYGRWNDFDLLTL